MANRSNRENEQLPLAENIQNRRHRNHCFRAREKRQIERPAAGRYPLPCVKSRELPQRRVGSTDSARLPLPPCRTGGSSSGRLASSRIGLHSTARAEAALSPVVRVRGAFLSRLCLDHDSSQAPPDMIATPATP